MESERKASSEALAYILGLIRAGTYPWVAARAAGVPDEAFRQFMTGRSGTRTEILQAEAQARAKAEIDLKEKNPVAWLRYGPGRPTRDGAGWTGVARAAWDTSSDVKQTQVQLSRILHWFGRVTAVHPELRPEFAELLTEMGIDDAGNGEPPTAFYGSRRHPL